MVVKTPQSKMTRASQPDDHAVTQVPGDQVHDRTGRGADGVVASPAEAGRRHCVQRRETLAEAPLRRADNNEVVTSRGTTVRISVANSNISLRNWAGGLREIGGAGVLRGRRSPRRMLMT